MAKFRSAPKCEICGKLFKKPSLHKYPTCSYCRTKLKLRCWSKEKLRDYYLNKNSIHTQKNAKKESPRMDPENS